MEFPCRLSSYIAPDPYLMNIRMTSFLIDAGCNSLSMMKWCCAKVFVTPVNDVYATGYSNVVQADLHKHVSKASKVCRNKPPQFTAVHLYS